MKPQPIRSTSQRLESILVAVWAAALTGVLWSVVVVDGFERRSFDLALEQPKTFLDDPSIVTVPSRWGRMLWHSDAPLVARLGPLEPGDELLLNLRADCPETRVRVEIGDQAPSLQITDLQITDRWHQHAIGVSSPGAHLRLRRLAPEHCDIHISRLSARNVRDHSEGLVTL